MRLRKNMKEERIRSLVLQGGSHWDDIVKTRKSLWNLKETQEVKTTAKRSSGKSNQDLVFIVHLILYTS